MGISPESYVDSRLEISKKQSSLHGIINVNKPRDITSMDVVRRIKRASWQKRVGHGGTLDPIATGVIPVCLGQATRMMEYLIEGVKEYRGVLELGVETDTYDALGKVVARKDPTSLTKRGVEEALKSFVGITNQVPPMYSALKKQGKRLYELARAGVEVEREPRKVKILEAVLERWNPPSATIRVVCKRGLYMRSLAHDMGIELGVGGHLTDLTRLRSGSFAIETASSLESIEQAFTNGTWLGLLHSPDVVVSHWKSITLDQDLEQLIRQGRPIPSGVCLSTTRHGEKARIYSADGRFLAIATFDIHLSEWRPSKVFNLERIDSGFDNR